MNKELSDRVWKYYLPKEFKKEVKKIYGNSIWITDYDQGYKDAMENLFGHHNLSSDAEGEDDEMLCVSRKDMQFYYQYYKAKRESELSAEQKAYYKGRTKVLLDLFGSKCLPDEPTIANNATVEEPKPAGPKFRVGQKVRIHGVNNYILCGKAGVVRKLPDEIEPFNYKIDFEDDKYAYLSEEYLEPYTEPEEEIRKSRTSPEASTCTDACSDDRPSQCKNQDFDNILKDSFSKERRLNIAAMIAAGWIAHDGPKNMDPDIMAADSLTIADALIAESEKGGSK